jgi:hypothetical protein
MDGLNIGMMVCFVDETPGDYNHHEILPALVQHIYEVNAERGNVHLHVFEAYPEDNRAVDALYSKQHDPGTWHWIEKV